MSFREICARYLEPASMAFMVGGIVALCQPWHHGLHSWGVTIILVGLVGFNIAAHMPKPAAPVAKDH
jgi:type IV secretory pathway VirB2 component (pilin)